MFPPLPRQTAIVFLRMEKKHDFVSTMIVTLHVMGPLNPLKLFLVYHSNDYINLQCKVKILSTILHMHVDQCLFCCYIFVAHIVM